MVYYTPQSTLHTTHEVCQDLYSSIKFTTVRQCFLSFPAVSVKISYLEAKDQSLASQSEPKAGQENAVSGQAILAEQLILPEENTSKQAAEIEEENPGVPGTLGRSSIPSF